MTIDVLKGDFDFVFPIFVEILQKPAPPLARPQPCPPSKPVGEPSLVYAKLKGGRWQRG